MFYRKKEISVNFVFVVPAQVFLAVHFRIDVVGSVPKRNTDCVITWSSSRYKKIDFGVVNGASSKIYIEESTVGFCISGRKWISGQLNTNII